MTAIIVLLVIIALLLLRIIGSLWGIAKNQVAMAQLISNQTRALSRKDKS